MSASAVGIWSVSQQRGAVTIRQGKGNKERIVPVGARALGWVARYLAQGRDALCREKRSEALFLANDGEGFSPGGLTHHIGSYVRQSGVREHGSCHLFRHTMATLMLENGADPLTGAITNGAGSALGYGAGKLISSGTNAAGKWITGGWDPKFNPDLLKYTEVKGQLGLSCGGGRADTGRGRCGRQGHQGGRNGAEERRCG